MNNKEDSPFESLHDIITTNSRDWSDSKSDAWIYGIIVGWETEPEDLIDGEDPQGALKELQKKFNWSDENVNKLRLLHEKFKDIKNLY
jgi:hypothetical protein